MLRHRNLFKTSFLFSGIANINAKPIQICQFANKQNDRKDTFKSNNFYKWINENKMYCDPSNIFKNININKRLIKKISLKQNIFKKEQQETETVVEKIQQYGIIKGICMSISVIIGGVVAYNVIMFTAFFTVALIILCIVMFIVFLLTLPIIYLID